MQDHSAAHEIVVLAALASIHVQLRHPGVKVPHLATQTQTAKQVHIESQADLEHSGGSARSARVCSTKLQRRVLTKMAKTAARANQGEIPLWGKTLARIEGVTKNER
jgi:hypothetical protein